MFSSVKNPVLERWTRTICHYWKLMRDFCARRKLLKAISSDYYYTCFAWKSPIVMRRVHRIHGLCFDNNPTTTTTPVVPDIFTFHRPFDLPLVRLFLYFFSVRIIDCIDIHSSQDRKRGRMEPANLFLYTHSYVWSLKAVYTAQSLEPLSDLRRSYGIMEDDSCWEYCIILLLCPTRLTLLPSPYRHDGRPSKCNVVGEILRWLSIVKIKWKINSFEERRMRMGIPYAIFYAICILGSLTYMLHDSMKRCNWWSWLPS